MGRRPTLTVQGGAALVAAKKLRNELLKRAAQKLGVDAATLDLKDGVIRSKADPQKSIAAKDLLDGKSLRMHGEMKAVGRAARWPRASAPASSRSRSIPGPGSSGSRAWSTATTPAR